MSHLTSNLWVITVVGGLVVFIIGSIIVTKWQEARNRKHSLTIIKATYGRDNKFVDITTQLNSQIDKNKLDIILSNDIAGDPIERISKIGKLSISMMERRTTKSMSKWIRSGYLSLLGPYTQPSLDYPVLIYL